MRCAAAPGSVSSHMARGTGARSKSKQKARNDNKPNIVESGIINVGERKKSKKDKKKTQEKESVGENLYVYVQTRS